MKIFYFYFHTQIFWLIHKFYWYKVRSGSVEKSDGSGSCRLKIPGSSALLDSIFKDDVRFWISCRFMLSSTVDDQRKTAKKISSSIKISFRFFFKENNIFHYKIHNYWSNFFYYIELSIANVHLDSNTYQSLPNMCILLQQ